MGGNCSGLNTREPQLPLDPRWHTARTSQVLQPQSDGSNCERPRHRQHSLIDDSIRSQKVWRSGRVCQTLILSYPESQQQHHVSRQEEDESSKQTALCHAEQHRAVLGIGHWWHILCWIPATNPWGSPPRARSCLRTDGFHILTHSVLHFILTKDIFPEACKCY